MKLDPKDVLGSAAHYFEHWCEMSLRHAEADAEWQMALRGTYKDVENEPTGNAEYTALHPKKIRETRVELTRRLFDVELATFALKEAVERAKRDGVKRDIDSCRALADDTTPAE